MRKVFYKSYPFDKNGKSMIHYCYNITHNVFEAVDRKKINKIIDNQIYVNEDGKINKARFSKFLKEEIVENHGRDPKSLKRKMFTPYTKGMFKEGHVLISNNCVKALHKKAREPKHKIVFDVLSNRFIQMTNEEYKEENIGRCGRNFLIEKKNNMWKHIRYKSKTFKYPNEINEIEAQDIQAEVGENLITWKSKGKFVAKCNRCINSCKQPRTVKLVNCRMFKRS